MTSQQSSARRVHALRTFALWLFGSGLLLAALWAGPGAWAAGLSSCGQGTVPGPCANDDTAGTTAQTAIAIDVLANDEDRSGTGLNVSGMTAPANGTAALAAGSVRQMVVYTPAAGFSGTDRFFYTVRDGLGITATGSILVLVAAQEQQKPFVQPINPQTDTVTSFPSRVTLPDGSTVAVTTTVQVPPGAFTFTLRPTDTLAIVFQPVVTPTGNVATPPQVTLRSRALGQHAGAPGNTSAAGSKGYQWVKLTFDLEALLNTRPLGQIGLAKPLTLQVTYSPGLLHGRNPYTLNPYYWTGSAWSNAGILITGRDVAANKIIFTVDGIVGELSFFAQPGAMLYLPQVKAALGANPPYLPPD
jgi:hypothetical protein